MHPVVAESIAMDRVRRLQAEAEERRARERARNRAREQEGLAPVRPVTLAPQPRRLRRRLADRLVAMGARLDAGAPQRHVAPRGHVPI